MLRAAKPEPTDPPGIEIPSPRQKAARLGAKIGEIVFGDLEALKGWTRRAILGTCGVCPAVNVHRSERSY
eukprot:6169627-Amphidinium_carterae.1